MPPTQIEPVENDNENILVDATLIQNEKLDELNDSNDAQVQGIIQTNDHLEELNSGVDILIEKLSQEKEVPSTKFSFEVDGAEIQTIEGPKGDKGDKGEKGDKGDTGAIGKTGMKGSKGDKGDTGPQGVQGLTGATGIQGFPGKQGTKGEKGDRGDDGKNGKDAPEIAVDKLVEEIKQSFPIDEIKKDVEGVHTRINKIASKTVSLKELDDVDLSQATVTNGKYVIGGGSGAVDSVNGATGTVVLDADDIDDTSTTHKFVTASDITTLGDISSNGTTTTVDADLVVNGDLVKFNAGGTAGWMGYGGGSTSYSGLWLKQASPSFTNYDFLSDGSYTFINAATNLYFRIANVTQILATSSALTITPNTTITGTIGASNLSGTNTGDNATNSQYFTASATTTLTNKRITKRVTTTTDDASAVINIDTTDVYELSAIANATTFTLTGTPTDGQTLMIRFKDAGVAKGLTWTGFTAIGVTLPTTTVTGKWHYVGCTYNLAATAWHVIAVSVEA